MQLNIEELQNLYCLQNIVTCLSVTIDGVLIGNRIYWTLKHTTHDYTLQITITQR
jgi:hypothetical protein